MPKNEPGARLDMQKSTHPETVSLIQGVLKELHNHGSSTIMPDRAGLVSMEDAQGISIALRKVFSELHVEVTVTVNEDCSILIERSKGAETSNKDS